MTEYTVVYSSLTGNTARLAEQVKKAVPDGLCVYAGGPDEKAAGADFIFAGFWTDKGSCDDSMAEFLRSLENKTVFLFGTAGFGGSEEYFSGILSRVEEYLDQSNTLAGSFMCQGKMPPAVRRRYESMAAENPEKGKPLLDNYDKALAHPDRQDMEALEKAVCKAWIEYMK